MTSPRHTHHRDHCGSSFFFLIFLMWTIFKVFIELVTILFLLLFLGGGVLAVRHLSSPTRDRTHTL